MFPKTSIKKELDCELICEKIFLKTNLRCYGDETTTFHSRKIPETGSNCICLSIKLTDSVLETVEIIHRSL